jgi:predicted DCC family thiol-disulfide oxidoreductase YuxK
MTPSDLDLRRAILLYRASCPKCRLISKAIVVLSCGRIRRVPLDSATARALYDRFGEPQARIALFYRGAFRIGRAIPASMAMAFLPFRLTLE